MDGLRAVAVVAVVCYHLGYGWAAGGFLGVDLFFVLSGFLITTLLLDERTETGRIAFVAFWRRRARRLLPALFIMVAVVAAFPWLATELGHQSGVATVDLGLLRGFSFSSLFYVANWFQIASGHSYFAQFAAPSALAHTWSLAIEEQFYLIWPFVTYALCRAGVARGRRMGVGVSVAVAVASSATMAAIYLAVGPSSTNFVYNATFTRFFDLGIGAALAWLTVGREVGPRMQRVATPLGLASAAVFVVACVWAGTSAGVPRAFMFDGGFLACAVVAAALIASVRAEGSLVARALSLTPVRYLGQVSYGVYLWHWPVIVYVTPRLVGVAGHTLLVLRLALIAGLTLTSYYLIEQPIRQRRLPVIARRAVAVAGTAVTLAVVATTTAAFAFPTVDLASELSRYAPASPPLGSDHIVGTPNLSWLPAAHVSAHHRLRVLLLGDSVSYYSGFELAAALSAVPGVHGEVRAFPGFGIRSRTYWPFYLDDVVKFRPEVVIIANDYDDIYALQHPLDYQQQLRHFIAQLRADGVDLVILASTPVDGAPPSDSGSQAATFVRVFAAANRTWRNAAIATAAYDPGFVVYAPAGTAVEIDGAFSAWMAPERDPTAARSTWDRVRMVDGTHLCPLGAEAYGAALAADVATLTHRPAASSSWWLGSWRFHHVTVLAPSPLSCPNDHP